MSDKTEYELSLALRFTQQLSASYSEDFELNHIQEIKAHIYGVDEMEKRAET